MNRGVKAQDLPPDAQLPEAAVLLLATRSLNHLLHTDYRPEEVAEYGQVFWTIVSALQAGIGA